MKELKSMVEKIKEVKNRKLNTMHMSLSEFSYDNLHDIYKHEEFLSQKLELWMFVPCDENGNVLEEPNIKDAFYGGNHFAVKENSTVYHRQNDQYQKAKDRLLFEGFEVKNKELIYKHNNNTFNFLVLPIEEECTIEFACTLLQGVEPTLTATALKKIKL